MRYADCTVGRSASRTHTVTEADIVAFAAVSGDDNPLHLDPAVGAASMYGERIAHGMLSASYISALIGTQLPGNPVVYVTQQLAFRRPVKIGDTITTEGTIVERLEDKRQLRMSTVCRNQRGKAVIEGEAVVLVPEEAG